VQTNSVQYGSSCGDGLFRGKVRGLAPTLHDDPSFARIQRQHEPVGADGRSELAQKIVLDVVCEPIRSCGSESYSPMAIRC
jgi:hypothetical protein